MGIISGFFRDEDGAVTVDWVVLTSMIVTLGVAVAVSVGGSTKNLADKIGNDIETRGVWTY